MSLTKQEIGMLQDASEHLVLRNTLNSGAGGSILFGLIAVGIGFASLEEHPLNGLLVALGVGLVFEGIWVASTARPYGMILEGLAMLSVGAWNLVITMLSMEQGGGFGLFGILGMYQIYWAFKSFAGYSRFAHLADRPTPPKELLERAQQLIASASTPDSDEANAAIEFQEGDATWKATLFDDVAVMIKNEGEEVLFLDGEQFAFAAAHAEGTGDPLNIRIEAPNRMVSGTIAADGIEACRQWSLCKA